MKRIAFTTYHPAANFIFFALVLVLTVVIFHPLALAVSLVGALAMAIKLDGFRAIRYFCGLPLVIMILSMVMNPLFVHKGISVLFYIGESPVTREAVIYGANTALMLGSVIMWFYCYSLIMTSDRFMAVFGKRAPSTSLIFSMVLRFLPRMRRQAEDIAMAQRCLGRKVSDSQEKKSRTERLHNGLAITSILTTWALENSIDTADSMRARGYGCGRRSHYSKYEMKPRDVVFMAAVTAVAAGLLAAKAMGTWTFNCYPLVEMSVGTSTAIMTVLMAAVCFCPLMMEITEEVKCRQSESAI